MDKNYSTVTDSSCLQARGPHRILTSESPHPVTVKPHVTARGLQVRSGYSVVYGVTPIKLTESLEIMQPQDR